MAVPLKLLLVEDNPADAALIQAMLEGQDLEIDWVQLLDEGVQKMTTQAYDAVLLDLSLPDSKGIESVATTHLFDTETPIIVLTGLDDDDAAFEALRAGAQDYLVKGNIDGTDLVRTVRFARERVQVQRQLATQTPRGRAEAGIHALACPSGAGMFDAMRPFLENQVTRGPIAYLTFDRPGTIVDGRLKELGIKSKDIHIIDASGQGDADGGRIHAPDDPRDLEALGLEVELACAALGPDTYVLVDSINSMILQHGIEAAAVFSHGLGNRLRVLNIGAAFIGHRNQEWPYILDRFSFVDGELELETVAESLGDPSVA